MRRLLLLVVFALSTSCGGTATTGGGSASSGGETGDDEFGDMLDEPVVDHRGDAVASIGITGPATPWADMSRADREMYMVGKVLPIMNQLFAQQFPTRYAQGREFTCATCHGDEAAAHNWAMPSGALMPLPAQGSAAATALGTSMPESLRFMREVVTPAMGTLVGASNYRCSSCHTSMP